MSSDELFEGKVALVTGAGSGMGEATSIAFAAAGAKVVAADIDQSSAAATVDRIKSNGGEALSVRVDVADARAVEELIRVCVDAFGSLDCAVNNAGIEVGTAKLADADDADFDRQVAVNLKGVYLCLKHEIRQMLQQDGGTIVNIASVNSFRPQIGQASYTATKHGVVGLTKSAAVEYAENGIRVNAVAPGAIDTPMLQAALAKFDLDAGDTARRMTGMGRFGESAEIANAVLWLCSPLSGYTNGHVLAVDGGFLAG